MLDFKSVFFPRFDPLYYNFITILVIFSVSYYTSFTSLAFRRSRCSYPSSSLSAVVFIPIQHVCGKFFGHLVDTDTIKSQTKALTFIDRAIARSIHQGRGVTSLCNDRRTDEVNKLFIIWPFHYGSEPAIN